MSRLAQPENVVADKTYRLQKAGSTPYITIDHRNQLTGFGIYQTFWPTWKQHFNRMLGGMAHELQKNQVVVWGPLAELAITAVTGALDNDYSPRRASIQNAATARVVLDNLANVGDRPAADLVALAVRLFGFQVKPWWSRLKCDETGRVLWDAPEYHLAWELSTIDLHAVELTDAHRLGQVIDWNNSHPRELLTVDTPLPALQDKLVQIESDRAEAARRKTKYETSSERNCIPMEVQ